MWKCKDEYMQYMYSKERNEISYKQYKPTWKVIKDTPDNLFNFKRGLENEQPK